MPNSCLLPSGRGTSVQARRKGRGTATQAPKGAGMARDRRYLVLCMTVMLRGERYCRCACSWDPSQDALATGSCETPGSSACVFQCTAGRCSHGFPAPRAASDPATSSPERRGQMDNTCAISRTRCDCSPCSSQDNGTLLAVTGTHAGSHLTKALGSDKGDGSSTVTEVTALAREK